MENHSQLREIVRTNILRRHSLKEVYDLLIIFLALGPFYGEFRNIRNAIASLPIDADPEINALINRSCDLYYLSLCADDNLTKTGESILAETEALNIIRHFVEANERIENDLALRMLVLRTLHKVAFKRLHEQFSTEESLTKLMHWVETFDSDGEIITHFRNYWQKILAA